jgi:hypothetical protein
MTDLTGDPMATDDTRLHGLPEPAELQAAFSRHRPVDWGDDLPTTAQLVAQYGVKATARSLEALRQSIEVEPRVTSEFLAAVPTRGAAYQLDSRVKSPESLARKFQNLQKKTRRASPEDIHRYTVLTQSPDDLVNAAEYTVERLRRSNWQATYAVHTYTERSRYKGIHAYLRTPGGQRVEVQFHSAEAARVKELTTPWYQIERSPDATPEERATARARCIELSDSLKVPRGLDDLSHLGGVRVAVRNDSDSPTTGQAAVPASSLQGPVRPGARQRPTATRNNGITR